MAVIKGPEQVYDKYIADFGLDGDGDPNAVALFAFSLVERDKYDWIEHHRLENNDQTPTDEQIEQWYLMKPESYFQDRAEKAEWWYKAFARRLLQDEIKEKQDEAVREFFSTKMGFMSQLLVSLACNAVFVVLLGAVAVYVFADFSPIAWVKGHITTR